MIRHPSRRGERARVLATTGYTRAPAPHTWPARNAPGARVPRHRWVHWPNIRRYWPPGKVVRARDVLGLAAS